VYSLPARSIDPQGVAERAPRSRRELVGRRIRYNHRLQIVAVQGVVGRRAHIHLPTDELTEIHTIGQLTDVIVHKLARKV